MSTQTETAAKFRELHEREGAFIIPNPWDVGTARALEKLGFEALATTSSGLAFSLGVQDHEVGRDDVLSHCESLVAAVDIPVNADLGSCFGDDPQVVADTMRLAVQTGIAGASVEDMKPDGSIYDINLATERVQAAVEVARVQPFPFMFTARAENFLVGKRDLDDTVRRLQAFQQAGADVLYAPGLRTTDEIRTVVDAVERPVNVIAGIKGFDLTFADLEDLGVKRISLGSALAAVAATAFVRAAQEMKDRGTFSLGGDWLSLREIHGLLGR